MNQWLRKAVLLATLAAASTLSAELLLPGYGVSGYFSLPFPDDPGSISPSPRIGKGADFSMRKRADALEIRVEESTAIMGITLRDLRGREVRSHGAAAKGQILLFPLRGLPSGVYVIAVEAEGLAPSIKTLVLMPL